ncbi:MAG: hypothetical protein GX640_20030 [Fibrobacter sp.]|nr:hypothetical protein [Fibrobacter sp.]
MKKLILNSISLVLIFFSISFAQISEDDLLPLKPGLLYNQKSDFYVQHNLTPLQKEYTQSKFYKTGNYVVIGTVKILPNTTVEFDKGSNIFFEPGRSSITVQGSLQINGIDSLPVTLRSLSFDELFFVLDSLDTTWAGIKVDNTGNLGMYSAKIYGSSQGIVSAAPCSALHISDVTFYGPHKKLSIMDKDISISSESPYTHICPDNNIPAKPVLAIDNQTIRKRKIKWPVTVICGILSAASSAAAYYFDQNLQKELINYNSSASSLDAVNSFSNCKRYHQYRNISYVSTGSFAVLTGFSVIIPLGRK